MDTVTEVEANSLGITLEAAAAAELDKFIHNSELAAENKTVGLRLSVVGGGCAGFQYRLSLDQPKADDMIFESEGQKVFVDPVSMNFVNGSTITYRYELSEAGFDVLNPNTQTACGCGSSFAMKD